MKDEFMDPLINQSIQEAIAAVSKLATREGKVFIQSVAREIIECYRSRRKLLLAGNGGSLCDAIHFAEELTGRFRKDRPPLCALALADPGHLTCVGNDMGFEEVFVCEPKW